MDVKNILSQIGLTPKQANVYLRALELGKFSILELARVTKLKRPTCYVIVDELIEQGLIFIIPGVKKRLFSAQHPDTLLRRARENYRLAAEILPQLQNIMKTSVDKPSFKIYIGQEGVRNIYEDMLKNNQEKVIYYIASVKDLLKVMQKEYLQDWVARRLNKGIRAVSIRIKSKEVNIDSFMDTKGLLREIYYAPSGFYIPYSIYIYGQRVAFISTEKDMMGFVMESDDFSQTMKSFFSFLLKSSKQ